jgi:hypothetical protein
MEIQVELVLYAAGLSLRIPFIRKLLEIRMIKSLLVSVPSVCVTNACSLPFLSNPKWYLWGFIVGNILSTILNFFCQTTFVFKVKRHPKQFILYSSLKVMQVILETLLVPAVVLLFIRYVSDSSILKLLPTWSLLAVFSFGGYWLEKTCILVPAKPPARVS